MSQIQMVSILMMTAVIPITFQSIQNSKVNLLENTDYYVNITFPTHLIPRSLHKFKRSLRFKVFKCSSDNSGAFLVVAGIKRGTLVYEAP